MSDDAKQALGLCVIMLPMLVLLLTLWLDDRGHR